MTEQHDQGSDSAQVNQATTPSSSWKANGQRDPHGDRYNCERANLALGHLTDDELANAVFMGANEPLDVRRMMAEDPDYYAPMALLTAAKDRIRWLSRALEKALTAGDQVSDEHEPQHIAQTIAEVAVEQLLKSGAPNYQEFHIDFQVDGEERVRPVVVTIAFADGPSPHQLRMQAEQERDAALAKLEAIGAGERPDRELLQRAAEMLSSCRGEIYSHIVSPHCKVDPVLSSPSLRELDALRDELLAAAQPAAE
ncbi:hypothetical protein ACYPKM_01030 [Pseudomonas aeruginosa]